MPLHQKDRDTVAHVLSGLSVPVFLAGLDEGKRPLLTAYTAFAGSARKLTAEIRSALAQAGLGSGLRVKLREERALDEATSLEALLNRFPHDQIVYDPVGCFGRAAEHVRFAARLRAELGDRLSGVYLEPVRRTVYLVLDRSRVVHGQVVRLAELREIENGARKALAQSFAGSPAGAVPALRLGLSFPAVGLVPVDQASAPPRRRLPGLRAAAGIAASLAALIGLSYPNAAEADGPAVSAPNAKLSGSGGAVDGSGAGIVAGSLTLPVGQRYGFQVDAAGGVVEGDGFGGVGAHLFWRDPDQALLGLIGNYAELDDRDVTRLGVEGELYLGQFSILARGGYQFGDYPDEDGILDDQKGGFGAAELRWYATENFVVGGGVRQDDDKTGGIFGAEFQPGFAAAPGLSLFADGEVGENDYYSALLGIRYYFGETKSLIDRHRRDDPATNLVTDSQSNLHTEEDDDYGGAVAPPPNPPM